MRMIIYLSARESYRRIALVQVVLIRAIVRAYRLFGPTFPFFFDIVANSKP